MRIFSALAVLGVCSGVGSVLRGRMLHRVRVLEQLSHLPAELQVRVVGGREPIPAIVASLAREEMFSELTFLTDCAAAYRAGGDFPDAWENAAKRFGREQRGLAQTGDALAMLGSALCGGNETRLASLLAQFTQLCTQRLAAARQQAAATGKLCAQLGVGTGILLGILIL